MGGGNRGEREWGELLMALPVNVTMYRNYTDSDITNESDYSGEDFRLPSAYSWDTPSGKQFIEWNTARDGSGTSYSVGDTIPRSPTSYYSIWGDVSIDYLTNSNELKSVANAIRTKGGTSESLTYPSGFVSAIQAISTGTNISDTTATASDVRTGKYFYTSSGIKTQGSIQDQSAQTITPTTSDQTIASGKYLTGAQTIKGDANLVAGNIKKDVSIFGVTGSYEGGGGSSATTVTFYDNGSGTAIFGGNYIAYIDGNGDYQLTNSLKDPSSEPESYQMLSGSLLTYVATTDPERLGTITASYTGMTFKESKKITLSRQSVYLRFYQID